MNRSVKRRHATATRRVIRELSRPVNEHEIVVSRQLLGTSFDAQTAATYARKRASMFSLRYMSLSDFTVDGLDTSLNFAVIAQFLNSVWEGTYEGKSWRRVREYEKAVKSSSLAARMDDGASMVWKERAERARW